MFKIAAVLLVVWSNGEPERIPMATVKQCLDISAAIAPAVESADCFIVRFGTTGDPTIERET